MNAFFASVEQRDHPELRGKPIVVGGDGPRGVVSTASYEARKYGCHSAQPTAVAKRLCPQLIVVRGRMDVYSQVSDQMFAILESYSPLIQPLSVDEAFIDLTGTERLHGSAEDVARRIMERIKSELSLTASVGVAPNKFLAKLASDLLKPDGLTIIRTEDVDRVLPPLPVSVLWGIGKVTASKLEKIAIRTIADLRKASPDLLEQYLGTEAARYQRLAYGIDDRAVTPDREAKSIGQERTFSVNVADPETIQLTLMSQVERVGQRLRKHGLMARGLSVKIRYGHFETITRATTLPASTNSTIELWHAAKSVLDAWPFQPVRLIGVAADRLSAGTDQLPLFPDPSKERQQKLDGVSDAINEKFGKRAIRRAGI